MKYTSVIGLLMLLLGLSACEDLGVPPEPVVPVRPALSVDNVVVPEGNSANFTVTMSESTSVDVSFSYSLLDGVASGGTDFQAASGTRTIQAGRLSTTIPVTALSDFLNEGDESFSLVLSGAVNATFADSVGTATIPGSTLPFLSVADLTIPEGSAGTVQVTSSLLSAVDITFAWTTQSGTAQGGADFVGGSGVATIIAGTLSTGIPIQVNADAVTEGDETFSIVLTNPTNALISDGTGVITIPANTAPVSYVGQIRPLLSASCAILGCHGGGSSDGGLAMGAATYVQVRNATGIHGAIISTPPVGANSNLYRCLTTSPPAGIGRMPNGGPFFSTQQQQLFKDWIDQGALDN